jgi:hypothetical protein
MLIFPKVGVGLVQQEPSSPPRHLVGRVVLAKRVKHGVHHSVGVAPANEDDRVLGDAKAGHNRPEERIALVRKQGIYYRNIYLYTMKHVPRGGVGWEGSFVWGCFSIFLGLGSVILSVCQKFLVLFAKIWRFELKTVWRRQATFRVNKFVW